MIRLGSEPAEHTLIRTLHRPWWWFLLRFFMMIVIAVVVVIILGWAVLLKVQDQMIFHPSKYWNGWETDLKDVGRRVEFSTSQGKQVAFYLPPSEAPDEAPAALWVFFSGNASLALNWMDFVHRYPEPRTGFLLVEYPGYGESEGKPGAANIREASLAAFEALASDLSVPVSKLQENMGAIGHSLGAAAAMQFAAEQPVKGVILIAPFTSLRAMARRAVGPVFAVALRHNMDNEARLEELAKRAAPPKVLIIHGTQDQVVPHEMGESLAKGWPAMVKLHSVQNGDHDSVVFGELRLSWQFMQLATPIKKAPAP